MLRMSRLLLVALALPAVLAVAACGEENVPGNAVVRVGDDLIPKTTFDKWMRIAATSSQTTQGTQQRVSVPQPPDFAQCVTQKKTTQPKPARGQQAPTDANLRTQCRQEYEALRDQVLQLLINERWISGEAAERGVRVSDADVRRVFDQQRKQAFPKDSDYREFLRTSGFTEDDILFRIRLEQLGQKLQESVVKGKDQVSDQQIRTYYDRNRQRFAQPERRDLRVVLARTRERADEARQAIDGGRSWREVSQEFSIDDASKAAGGVLANVARGSGQLEPAVERAVFEAQDGELEGPVRSQFGFYVFQVQKVTPPSQQTLEQARTAIRNVLATENQNKALQTFIDDYQKEWREKTTCQDGFVIADVCANGPKTDTTSTGAAPGAVPPQSGTPQQPGQPGQPAQPQTPPPAPAPTSPER